MSGDRESLHGAGLALASAALFGASAPLSKLLLPHVGTLALSALLYLGAGAGLLVYAALRPREARPDEARLQRADVLPLAGVVAFGGVVGPALLLFGLRRVSGLAGSLLLNLEAPLTMLVAVSVFREHLGGRTSVAAAMTIAGAALLGLQPGALHADPLGVAAIAGACLSWALDNNLSQRLSLRDPIAIVRVKGLGAGACTLALAAAAGETLPARASIALSLALGAVSYGASLVLNLRALRVVGAARVAAFFATAPFIGAALSVVLLGDRPTAADGAAAALMVAGVFLLTREHHEHEHVHEPLEHDHAHVHDAHHRHAHEGPFTEPHAHAHRHDPLTHTHAHAPDVHHRHRH